MQPLERPSARLRRSCVGLLVLLSVQASFDLACHLGQPVIAGTPIAIRKTGLGRCSQFVVNVILARREKGAHAPTMVPGPFAKTKVDVTGKHGEVQTLETWRTCSGPGHHIRTSVPWINTFRKGPKQTQIWETSDSS
ncbi:hypothetical protein B0T24DRAFT_642249 [Lasiosphaeria ovina]|uniref:Secreted protein n=1 Tax=Lasiosphaeria ovina TaxID=92902 RepID=A0AAE0JTV8_9PEZI|nr:hypothetical protein B0T24DRAFT_642249 [Lasiosphaeria ovina]